MQSKYLSLLNRELFIKFLSGPFIGEIREFKEKDSPVNIGRSMSCAIHFPSSGLSRIQCQ